MRAPATYTLGELEQRSGFHRRNIAYYVQQGLLPRIGRRGPKTRYPETFLLRLQFISGIRDLQDRGQLPSITLAEIGRALGALAPQELRALVHAGLPAEELGKLFAATEGRETAPEPRPVPVLPPQRRSYGLADAGIRQRFPQPDPPTVGGPAGPDRKPLSGAPDPLPAPGPARAQAGRPGPGDNADQPAPDQDRQADLGELLRQLELQATLDRQHAAPGAPEQWTRIPITGRVYLSVRDLGPDGGQLAEAAAKLLRRALRERRDT